ncbi:MAG: hypothetical protein R2828_14285 [Saprospiraceae bacterium]
MRLLIVFMGFIFMGCLQPTLFAQQINHFIYFGRDRGAIQEVDFLKAEGVAGAQIKYTWEELEPQKGGYNFQAIQEDLDFLKANGKALFIQLQDVSFSGKYLNVPNYIMNEPIYNGGADQQYDIPGDDESKAKKEGWVARRWDPAVRERFHLLLDTLGAAFDGEIAGINLPETSVSFGEGKLHPPGFTFETYRDGILANMKALKEAFPTSIALQYANFMPGEFLPWTDRSYLRSVFQFAEANGLAIGGPDVKVGNKAHANNGYHFIEATEEEQVICFAVQYSNYKEDLNPATGKAATVEEIYEFAKTSLKVDYLFWENRAPFYRQAVLPFLANLAKQTEGRSPSQTMALLFESAKSNDPNLLKDLCPPNKSNDGDTDCICAYYAHYVPHKCPENSHNRMPWEAFVTAFKTAQLTDKITIQGNSASAPFSFGPDGKYTESMALVKVGNNWYLAGF